MATVEPSSAPTVPPTSGPGDDGGGAGSPGTVDYDAGFKDGKVEGYYAGRMDAWNSLLVCLGYSLGPGGTCDRRDVNIYLKSIECFLVLEKLSYEDFDNAYRAAIMVSAANIKKCGLEIEIQKLKDLYWVGDTP